MSPEDLERRRPVWAAMTDLFLDTEVRWNVPFVAWECARSGYDQATLDRIFWAEVFPLAIWNGLQVAGEWAVLVLDEGRLVRRAERGREDRALRLASGWMVQDEWKAALALVPWLRSAEDVSSRRQALDLLGRRYFEEPERESPRATLERAGELGVGLAEAWAVYEPLCRGMLVHEAHAPRAAAVEALIRAARA